MALLLPVCSWPGSLPTELRRHGLVALLDWRSAGPWEAEPLQRAVDTLERRGLARAPTRVHLAAELCALRLPATRILRREVAAWRAEGFSVSLVLPVAYQAAWEKLVRTVEALLEPPGEVTELVINDLGLLGYAARSWPVALATGRLFCRMKRDVFALDPTVLPAADGLDGAAGPKVQRAVRQAQQTGYGHPYLDEPERAAELASLRVGCVGLDVLPTPLARPLGGLLAHALYLPWTYLTSSRACPVAAAVEGGPTAHPTTRCRRPCRTHALVLTYPWDHPPIVQRGTGLFCDCSRMLDPFLDSAGRGIARYVLEPQLPW